MSRRCALALMITLAQGACASTESASPVGAVDAALLCTPGTITCRGPQAVACSAAGDTERLETCSAACVEGTGCVDCAGPGCGADAGVLLVDAMPLPDAPPPPPPPVEAGTLTPPQPVPYGLFGASVALSAGTILVGAPGTASAHVFTEAPGGWQASATLSAPELGETSELGESVAISGDVAVVGAREAGADTGRRGAAVIFVRDAVGWSAAQTLLPQDAGAADFGASVVIDGDTIAVADPFRSGRGAVYVYVRQGDTWSLQAELSPDLVGPNDGFGRAMAIDGDLLAVGAPTDSTVASAAGAAYVFRRGGSGWALERKVIASDAFPDQTFGKAIDIDGDRLAVGSPQDQDGAFAAGSVYLFIRDGGLWPLRAELQHADLDDIDKAGTAVALAGTRLLFGTPQKDISKGAAYLFAEQGSAWVQQAKLSGAGAGIGQTPLVGAAVATDGAVHVVGAPEDGPQIAGVVYVFRE